MATDRQPFLFVLGTSHHNTPLEIRESFALSPEVTRTLYRELTSDGTIRECLILNTCNRVEIYGTAETPDCRGTLQNTLARCLTPALAQSFMAHSFWKTDEETVRHAFELAAGLDSQIVGETEILGQIKGAYKEAKDVSATGSVLDRIFQKSFQAAKWARTHTAIGKGQVSIGNIAADLAIHVYGQLSESSLLLVGAGEVGEKTAQALLNRGARQITVTSRRAERARLIANHLHGTIIPFQDVPLVLGDFDIVVCSTSAPGSILSKEQIAAAMAKRPSRPLFLIDLAVPRDIDPAAGELENVYLYNFDDLAVIANENLKVRMADVDHCRKALSEKAHAVWVDLDQRRHANQGEKEGL